MKFSDRFLLMESTIKNLQTKICNGLESEDTIKFISDKWDRPEGGGGITNVIQNGSVFEKGGVNISSVHGVMPKEMAERLKTHEQNFAACGLSLVMHPYSPRIPTIHMNIRYFEMEDGSFWYGGGVDLTPYFPHKEDFQHFHQTMKKACDSIDHELHSNYKAECDSYFTIEHRNEMRGIGGVFFDYLKDDGDKNFTLVKAIGDAFLPSYLPIVQKRRDEDFIADDKQFQLIRRGRYVEFNLIYDRGTLFGLKTNGRVESILMSLPKEVNFIYDWKPEEGSVHAEMLRYYQPCDWVG
ncbi:MAG: oxygen-dependent coproporphyrinogen oxidase [Planctomycetota bacterium]|nr:MAG: oxygen-dependent coproporphyrinogen oxidase [Planctomycetota bacterium]